MKLVDQTITRLSHAAPEQRSAWNPDQWRKISEQEPLEITSNFSKESFENAVRKCVEYIRAGDIFQVVPSQRLSVRTDVDPFEIYRSLAGR